MLLCSLHLKESLIFQVPKFSLTYQIVTAVVRWCLQCQTLLTRFHRLTSVKWKQTSASHIPFLVLLGRSFLSSYHLKDAGIGTGCFCAGRRLNRWQFHWCTSLLDTGSQRRGTIFCQCTWLVQYRKQFPKITRQHMTLSAIFLVVYWSALTS